MAREELPVKTQSVFKDVFMIRTTNQETVHATEIGQETYETYSFVRMSVRTKESARHLKRINRLTDSN